MYKPCDAPIMDGPSHKHIDQPEHHAPEQCCDNGNTSPSTAAGAGEIARFVDERDQLVADEQDYGDPEWGDAFQPHHVCKTPMLNSRVAAPGSNRGWLAASTPILQGIRDPVDEEFGVLLGDIAYWFGQRCKVRIDKGE